MKVGFIAEGFGMQSLKYIFAGMEAAIVERHEIVRRPVEYLYATRHKQDEMTENFLHSCDAIVGRIDERVLRVRERLGGQPPLIGFMLGTPTRGASDIAEMFGYLRSTDVLVGNCTGEHDAIRKFFTNAQTKNLPHAFDDTIFYPIEESQRQALKAEMGFSKNDRILLYAGRMSIEKNLHTTLKIFSVLQDLVPNLHLLVAGELENIPFAQFGVHSVDITGTVMKLIEQLHLNLQCVHFLGRRSGVQLRDLYAVADLFINMTLHHDENFGFSQVESMACGTPVIGTSWGGLKDTIRHGETGYQISAVVTDSGVKVNWWEAINRIVYLLEDDAMLQRFRERCPAQAMFFSKTRYVETLDMILKDCLKKSRNGGAEPLKKSQFGNEFWNECVPRPGMAPPFRRGPRAFQLYKELIKPFTGTTENIVPASEPLKADQVLVLAVPVEMENRTIQINDPIFPVEQIVPQDYQQTCEAALVIMRKEPVIRFGRLESLTTGELRRRLPNTLKWLLDAGILLRTKLMEAGIDPVIIGEQMGKPVFAIRTVDHTRDVIALS